MLQEESFMLETLICKQALRLFLLLTQLVSWVNASFWHKQLCFKFLNMAVSLPVIQPGKCQVFMMSLCCYLWIGLTLTLCTVQRCFANTQRHTSDRYFALLSFTPYLSSSTRPRSALHHWLLPLCLCFQERCVFTSWGVAQTDGGRKAWNCGWVVTIIRKTGLI